MGSTDRCHVAQHRALELCVVREKIHKLANVWNVMVSLMPLKV